jgi:hypothetical protein
LKPAAPSKRFGRLIVWVQAVAAVRLPAALGVKWPAPARMRAARSWRASCVALTVFGIRRRVRALHGGGLARFREHPLEGNDGRANNSSQLDRWNVSAFRSLV